MTRSEWELLVEEGWRSPEELGLDDRRAIQLVAKGDVEFTKRDGRTYYRPISDNARATACEAMLRRKQR